MHLQQHGAAAFLARRSTNPFNRHRKHAKLPGTEWGRLADSLVSGWRSFCGPPGRPALAVHDHGGVQAAHVIPGTLDGGTMRSIGRSLLVAALVIGLGPVAASAQRYRADLGINGGFSWYSGAIDEEQ